MIDPLSPSLNQAFSDPDGWILSETALHREVFSHTAIPNISIEALHIFKQNAPPWLEISVHTPGFQYHLDPISGNLSWVEAPRRSLLCRLMTTSPALSLERFRRFLTINFTALRGQRQQLLHTYFQARLLHVDPTLTGSYQIRSFAVAIVDPNGPNDEVRISTTTYPVDTMCAMLRHWRRDLFVPKPHGHLLEPVQSMIITLPTSAHARAALLSTPPIPPF